MTDDNHDQKRQPPRVLLHRPPRTAAAIAERAAKPAKPDTASMWKRALKRDDEQPAATAKPDTASMWKRALKQS